MVCVCPGEEPHSPGGGGGIMCIGPTLIQIILPFGAEVHPAPPRMDQDLCGTQPPSEIFRSWDVAGGRADGNDYILHAYGTVTYRTSLTFPIILDVGTDTHISWIRTWVSRKPNDFTPGHANRKRQNHVPNPSLLNSALLRESLCPYISLFSWLLLFFFFLILAIKTMQEVPFIWVPCSQSNCLLVFCFRL